MNQSKLLQNVCIMLIPALFVGFLGDSFADEKSKPVRFPVKSQKSTVVVDTYNDDSPVPLFDDTPINPGRPKQNGSSSSAPGSKKEPQTGRKPVPVRKSK